MYILHHNETAENITSYLSNNLCIILMINLHVHELDSTATIEYNVVIMMKYMHTAMVISTLLWLHELQFLLRLYKSMLLSCLAR